MTFNPSPEQMEAYRVEAARCEARSLARRTPNEINHFLELVAKARGQEAADALQLAVAREAYRANRGMK